MKKIFSFLAAGLLLASCSNDDFEGVKGNEQEVAITIELPSAISSRAQASGQNSALGGVSNMESLNVTFTAALYYGSNPDPIWTGNASTTAAVHAVTFKPTLVVGETYRLVSYAQFDGVATLESQVEAFGINDETQDAYFVTTDIVAEPVMSAVLKRPTGKLRLIANDYAEMKRQLGKDIKNVTVTYEDARYTTFNAKTGLWDTAALAATKEYTQAKTTYGTEKDAAEITVFADYIPVNTQTGEEHVSMVVDVTFTDDTHFTREINIDVPIKRNYLTTLVGDFFTSEMELTLIIDEVFENEEEYNYNELATAFELGGEYKLYNNMNVDKQLVLAAGKTLTLDLNGYSIAANPADSEIAIKIEEGAKLIVNGDGNVSTEKTLLYAVYGDLEINGGNHATGLEVAEVNGGIATISGGKFSAASAYGNQYWILNKKDNTGATISVTGGQFVNFDPANPTTENPNESFVATGYSSVKEGDVYTVVEGAANASVLADAFANGGEIKLIAEVTTDEQLVLAAGKTLTLDLGGQNLVANPEGTAIAIKIEEGAKLIVKGEGNVNTAKTLLYAVYGDLAIEGGNHSAKLEVAEVNGGTATISGGHFEAEPYNGAYWTLNKKDNTDAVISVSGGEFVGFNPANNVCENPRESFVAEGFQSVESEEGVWSVIPVYEAADAASLAELIAKGGEVKLTANITLDETLNVAEGKSVVLDLNGKTITNKVDNASTDVIVVAAGAELTINGDGAVTAVSGNDGYAIISKGKLTINGGTYRSGVEANGDGNCTIYVSGNGEIYINGGDFSTPEGDDTTYVINKKDGDRATTTIEITGGTFKNFNPGNNAAEGAGTNFLAAGYKSVETAEGSNVWTVVAE